MGRTRETINLAFSALGQRRFCVVLSLLALSIFIPVTGCSGGAVGTPLMTIDAMTPNTVYTTGGQVVFTGTNFSPNTSVTFGGVAAQKVYFQNSTLVTALAPP